MALTAAASARPARTERESIVVRGGRSGRQKSSEWLRGWNGSKKHRQLFTRAESGGSVRSSAEAMPLRRCAPLSETPSFVLPVDLPGFNLVTDIAFQLAEVLRKTHSTNLRQSGIRQVATMACANRSMRGF